MSILSKDIINYSQSLVINFHMEIYILLLAQMVSEKQLY